MPVMATSFLIETNIQLVPVVNATEEPETPWILVLLVGSWARSKVPLAVALHGQIVHDSTKCTGKKGLTGLVG